MNNAESQTSKIQVYDTLLPSKTSQIAGISSQKDCN